MQTATVSTQADIAWPDARFSNAPLTVDEKRKLLKIYEVDEVAYAQDLLRIADKDKKIVPLRYTALQRRALLVYQKIRSLGVPVRILNLKARQVMMSTLWTSVASHRWYFARGPVHITLIGDKYGTTASLEKMMHRYHDLMPRAFRRRLQQRGNLLLRDSQAYYKAETAKYMRAGQSTTGTIVIATEVPYYTYGEEVFTSLLQTVPDLPSTLVVLEGTANGASGYFYDAWQMAEAHTRALCTRFGAVDKYDLLFNQTGWGNGTEHEAGFWDGSFFPLFFAWWENPEYVWPCDLTDTREGTLTPDELLMRRTYSLSLEQISWVRHITQSKLKGNIEKRKQEYPSDPEEAFLYSGSPYFPQDIVRENEQRTKKIAPKLLRCTLEWDPEDYPLHTPRYNDRGVVTNKHALRVWARADDNGLFKLVRRPRETHSNRYCIGADVATGIAGGKGDFCVAYLKDRTTMESVMQFRGILNTKRFAEILAQLGYYYHNAGILVERNGPGEGVIANLLDLYPNHLVLKGLRSDHGDLVPDDKYGWHEGQTAASGEGRPRGTKVYLLDATHDFVSTTPEKQPFAEFWTDARVFMQDDQGRYGADGKRLDPHRDNHDDCVYAEGLALMADYLMLPIRKLRTSEIEKQRQTENVRTYIEEGVIV